MMAQPDPSPPAGAGDLVPVVPRHHGLVRLTHWLNVPLLLGMIATGLSIYWAAPVLQHARDPVTGRTDVVADLGAFVAGLLHDRSGNPGGWIYDHLGIGRYQLATALRLHWALAYLFMANGALYAIGLALGGGWRALLPRPGDVAEAWRMVRYYAGVAPMAMLRRPWPHPPVGSRYNALQRVTYFVVVLCGALVVLSGWAMHKPASLPWLERLFVSYDGARVVHFLCMVVLAVFVIPHVVLAVADGWDTFRAMVTGWSTRARGGAHERG